MGALVRGRYQLAFSQEGNLVSQARHGDVVEVHGSGFRKNGTCWLVIVPDVYSPRLKAIDSDGAFSHKLTVTVCSAREPFKMAFLVLHPRNKNDDSPILCANGHLKIVART